MQAKVAFVFTLDDAPQALAKCVLQPAEDCGAPEAVGLPFNQIALENSLFDREGGDAGDQNCHIASQFPAARIDGGSR